MNVGMIGLPVTTNMLLMTEKQWIQEPGSI